jgi:thymidylate synthase
MRQTIITLAILASTNAVAQDCLLTEKTVSKDLGVVQEIRNVQTQLSEWKNGYQTCTATLEGSINGQWGTGKGVYTWDGNSSSKAACSGAVELAKKNLLETQKDSTISAVSTVICKERPKQDQPVLNTKIGQVIDNINTLRKHPTFSNTFYHNGQSCRWFIETGWNGKDINQLNGIACNLKTTKWIVVDKF